MPLRLYNTMSAKVEEFRPLQNSEVRMYSCGPTVYDYGHIGNFRTFVAVDILREWKTVRGLMWTSTKKITHATSRCGKRRRRGKRHGRARLGAGAPAGTSSAR